MNKLLIVAPNAQIYRSASEIVQEAFLQAEVIQATSENAVELVQKEFSASAGVVVARGNQAHLLKTRTSIPVIDIELTAQEMAVLLHHACQMILHDQPRIAFVGFRYMFSDCTPIAQILGADVRLYYAGSGKEVPSAVERAVSEGAELVIGGEIACSHAQRLGTLCLFMDSMKDSIRYAIRTALHMMDALQAEQQKSAEFMSLLNYSFDAILRLDREGVIRVVNFMAERALHHTAAELIGTPFLELTQLQSSAALREALAEHRDLYSTVLRIDASAFVANLAAIKVEGETEGFIVSMQAFSQIDDLEEAIRRERRSQGYAAKAQFEDLKSRSPRLRAFLHDAQQYAQYDVPLTIGGPEGTDKRRLAECIHNASPRQPNPFVVIDLSIFPPPCQTAQVFGLDSSSRGHSLIGMGQKGTVYLEHIQLLNEDGQHQLLDLLCSGHAPRGGGQLPMPVPTRIIVSTSQDLELLAAQGRFLSPLAHLLGRMTLLYPPLCDTPEDIPQLLEDALDRAAAIYKKRITLTDAATEVLIRYPWPGNQAELSALCEKATILASATRVDEAFVLEKLLPASYMPHQARQVLVVSSPEENELRGALRRAGDDRQAAAELLGVSRSTLWRRMKKYGLLP